MELDKKRFAKNDSGFICGHCGKYVEPLGSSSRNHCPFCLWSIHVDENPGDRACECRGLMEPISATPDAKKGYIITHKCTVCGEEKRCRAAHEAKVQPDDIDLLIKLTVSRY